MSRGVSFQEIANLIICGDYLDILVNPARPGQELFVVRLRDYTWAVPFVVEDDETIFLKTAFPSRKLHKRYGGNHEDEDQA